MIIDSSAMVALLLEEPEADIIYEAMTGALIRRMSTATFVETATVADGRAKRRDARLERLLTVLDVELTPLSDVHARIARDAFNRYGKGMGSGATLNFGDYMTYGLAKATGLPLLYKGKDFGRTDLVPAIDWSEHG